MQLNEHRRYDSLAFMTAIFHLILIIVFFYLLLKMSAHPLVSGEQLMSENQAEKEARGREVIKMSQYALGALGLTWLYGIYNLTKAFRYRQRTGKRSIAAFLLIAPLALPVIGFLMIKLLG